MAAHTNIVLFLCDRASLKNAAEGCGLEQARHGHAWEEEKGTCIGHVFNPD